MNEQANKYEVTYHTRVGVGSTYYEGRVTVWAEDEDAAHDQAQREVQRRAFRDYSVNHIVVTSVTRKF